MTATRISETEIAAPHTKDTLPSLTGVRGLAAVMVFCVHVRLLAAVAAADSIPARIKGFGWAGVPMFFVLSGFLITWLALREIETTGGFNLSAFLKRRSLRLFPLYFTVVTFALAAAHAPFHSLANFGVPALWALPLMTFTTNIVISMHQSARLLNSVSILWSLSTEVQFYLVWSIFLKFFRQRGLLIVTLTAIAVSIVLRLTVGSRDFFIYREGPGASLASLMTGCLAALCFTAWRKPLRNVRFLEAALLAAFFATAFAGWPVPETTVGRGLLLTAVDVECGLLVFLMAQSGGFLARFFESRPLQFFGEVSYPFYVFHPIVLLVYYTALHHFHTRAISPWLSFTIDFLIAGSITIAISTLWNRIEKPLRQRRRRLSASVTP